MDGTADRSGIHFSPLSLWEKAYTGGREIPAQVRSLRPVVPKPPSSPHFSPCRAVPTGPVARSLPVGASQ
jgi:hypothetical protein